METGGNIASGNFLSDPSLNAEKFRDCHTVIHLAGDGLSLAVFNSGRRRILASDYHEWPYTDREEELIQRAETILLQHPLHLDQCLNLQWILGRPSVSLLPREMYKAEHAQSVLQLTTRLGDGDEIYVDHWPEQGVSCIYNIPADLHQWLKRNYPEASVIHSATAQKNLYNHLPQQDFFAFLMVGNGYAELFLANRARVVFYNFFTYGVEEDLLYYLLFALEQNRIIAPEIKLHIGGKVHQRQKLWILLQDYVGEIEALALPGEFSLSEDLNHHTFGRYINLLGGI